MVKEDDDVLELTRRLGREPNVEVALHILQWELGDLTKSYTYSKWHPALKPGYKAETIHALSSLVFQAEVIGTLLGVDLEYLRAFGRQTVLDHIDDKEKKLGRFEYYKGEDS